MEGFYGNGDYDEDPYDDDMYEGQDLPQELQAIRDNLDIRHGGVAIHWMPGEDYGDAAKIRNLMDFSPCVMFNPYVRSKLISEVALGINVS
ncbi:hypothetical protein Tco_0524028 [Tanacetum coccineum]